MKDGDRKQIPLRLTEQRTQYVAHLVSVLELASQDVEMPPVDRKGKGKARE
jgi:hypothetical protein